MTEKKGKTNAQLRRENAKWRLDLVIEIGRCQLPDCPGLWPREPHVHEIACGIGGRPLAFSERLACLVACDYCNQHRLTDYTLWPVPRQAALQCLLCAEFATPQEILDVINRCRGKVPNAIAWADVAKYLMVSSEIPGVLLG